MAIESVAQTVAPVAREIFAHRQRLDIANAASVKIAGCGVMDRVTAPPVIVGRHRQDAEGAAHPVIGEFTRKERAVPAIVLDQEQADEQSSGQRRQRERKPELAVTRCDHHRSPDRSKRREGHNELEGAASRARTAVGNEHLRPIARRPDRAFSFRRRHPAPRPICALEKSVVERGIDCAERRINRSSLRFIDREA